MHDEVSSPALYTALETEAEVRAAMKAWKAGFKDGSDARIGKGGHICHPYLDLWGHFGEWNGRMVNSFGIGCDEPGRNRIVEINPPNAGVRPVLQGVLARDAAGHRWILHKGRMSIPGRSITPADFARLARTRPVVVRSQNGAKQICHPVGNIDAKPKIMREQIAAYVTECRRVRDVLSLGNAASEQNEAIDEAERCFPELQGSYTVGPQDERTANRYHADVWKALVTQLRKLGVKLNNERVGRWGPDLRTVEGKPILFEIKVQLKAKDIQQAVGQLILYESLLEMPQHKVAVLPEGSLEGITEKLSPLGITVLPFRRRGSKVTFPQDSIHKILGRE